MKNNTNKSFLLFDNNRWHPSTFYDQKTELVWVMEYTLFIDIYQNKIVTKDGIKYAIHQDVYDAFLFKFNHSTNRKKRETRKRNIRNRNRKRTIKKE